MTRSIQKDKKELPLIKPEDLYGAKFHADRYARTIYAATTVLAPLIQNLNIQSAVDYGCGVGTWLAAAKSLKVKEVMGIEGPWVPRDQLKIDAFEYLTHDLAEPTALDRCFDLAISLEVGEHLPQERASSFVFEICSSSKYALFSAAIPEQGGQGHINEQWQSYWAGLFAENDFIAIDCIRQRIWEDDDINWWYKQNIILYVSRDHYEEVLKALKLNDIKSSHQLDIVHPVLYKMKTKKDEQLSKLLRVARKVFVQKVKNRVSRVLRWKEQGGDSNAV